MGSAPTSTTTALSSNGRMSASQAGDPGSIPGGATKFTRPVNIGFGLNKRFKASMWGSGLAIRMAALQAVRREFKSRLPYQFCKRVHP